jgi:hypothetical protein
LSDEKPPLTEAIRHLAEQERRSLKDHPSPATLAAYHAGELTPEEEAELREHLALCRHCSDLLLDLAGFADLAPPPGLPELTDAEVEEDWQALQARMGEKPADVVVPFRPAARVEPKSPYQPPRWFAIAASLLAVAGFSFGFYERGRLQEAKLPDLADNVVSLSTDRGPSGNAISSQRGGILIFDTADTFDQYEADILVGKSKVISLQGKQPYLHVPGGALKPGEYQIRLFGILNGNRELAGEFPLQVNAP